MNLLFLLFAISVYCSVFSVYRRIGNGTFEIYNFSIQRTLPIRGLLAVSIVLHHLACVVWHQNIPIVSEFMSWGGLVVSVFFFLTGYGLVLSYINKGRDYLNGFLLHRLKKVLLPLVVATFCFLIVQSLLSSSNAFISVSGLVVGNPPLPTSWFVYTILLFYCIFYFIARTFNQKYYHIIICLWISCCIYALVLHYIHWEECWYKSIYAIGLGATYAYYENCIKKWITERPQRLISLLVSCFAFLCLVRLINEHFIYTYMSVWKLFVYSLTPLLIVFFVYSLGSFNTPALDFLGRISYEIYLVQGAFRLWFRQIDLNWYLYFTLTFILTILCAWLFNKLMKVGIPWSCKPDS